MRVARRCNLGAYHEDDAAHYVHDRVHERGEHGQGTCGRGFKSAWYELGGCGMPVWIEIITLSTVRATLNARDTRRICSG
jgi:hypothetical protein